MWARRMRRGVVAATGCCTGTAAVASSSAFCCPAGYVDKEPSAYDSPAIVGGHVDGVRLAGAMLRKRLQSEGRGQREVDALAQLSRSQRWRRFVPAYEGTDVDQDGQEWLLMENLVDGMAKPAVLDLKVGLRHWSDDAPPTKIAKERKKAAATTVGSHGMRLVGCRFERRGDTGGWVEESWGYKLAGATPTDGTSLPTVIHRFLGSAQRRQTALTFVNELHALFAEQREYVFYGSSLLLAYDASGGPSAPLRIRMIDFGHVHGWCPAPPLPPDTPKEAQHRYDPGPQLRTTASDGYQYGLATLLLMLSDEELAQGCGTAVDKSWGAPGRWDFKFPCASRYAPIGKRSS